MIGTHLLGVVEEICLKQKTRQRRGEDTDHLLLPPLLDSLQLLTRETKYPRGQNIRKEGVRRCCLLLLQNLPFMIMEDVKEQDLSPQVAEVQSTLQPVRIMDQTPVIHSDNVVQQPRDSGSESDLETWSFDRAINEVFGLLPQELS